MNPTTAAARVNRKQTRAEVDGQIQKSIPALCQWFERMSHALRWGFVSLRDDPVTGNERLFLKVGSSRAYQDYDQEQGEYPLQPGAVRLNKFFAKYRPSKAKKALSLLTNPSFIALITVVFLRILIRCINNKLALALPCLIIVFVAEYHPFIWILRMLCRLIHLLFSRVRNCAFLVANATKNVVLATRIS